MKRIIFPIEKGNSGAAVGDLHAALELLGYQIPALEKQRQQFADGTAKLVAQFQKDNHLPQAQKIDATTADTLNKLAGDTEIIGKLKGHSKHLMSVGQKLASVKRIM